MKTSRSTGNCSTVCFWGNIIRSQRKMFCWRVFPVWNCEIKHRNRIEKPSKFIFAEPQSAIISNERVPHQHNLTLMEQSQFKNKQFQNHYSHFNSVKNCMIFWLPLNLFFFSSSSFGKLSFVKRIFKKISENACRCWIEESRFFISENKDCEFKKTKEKFFVCIFFVSKNSSTFWNAQLWIYFFLYVIIWSTFSLYHTNEILLNIKKTIKVSSPESVKECVCKIREGIANVRIDVTTTTRDLFYTVIEALKQGAVKKLRIKNYRPEMDSIKSYLSQDGIVLEELNLSLKEMISHHITQ